MRFCDRWWLVVADRTMVAKGELPPTWGLLAPRAGTLYTIVEAPKLSPEPLSRNFMATLLRRVIDGDALKPAPSPRARSVLEMPERADPRKVRARLERLQSTAERIQREIGTALYEMDRENVKAQRAAGDTAC